MPSTFSSWSSGEDARSSDRNSDNGIESRLGSELSVAPATLPAEGPIDELKEELAAARLRLHYFETFAPWIEEQMATVVERAAEVAGQSEREQERLSEEIERIRAEIERLAGDRDRLREEAKGVVADANATAAGVIDEANTRAARLLAEAHRNADWLVNRLRDEAAAIVSRAVGDLTALEVTNVAANPPSPAEETARREPWTEQADDGAASPGWIAASVEESGTHDLDVRPTEDDINLVVVDGEDIESKAHDPLPTGSMNGALSTAEGNEESRDSAGASTSESDSQEAGPFQWLRTALAGRETMPRNGAEEQAEAAGTPFADVDPFFAIGAAPAANESADDIFVTRLTIHPALSGDERARLQRRVEGMTGVQRVALGAVADDFFELLVTHQLFTSLLGSLLAAAGEHLRLIAQHEDSLEVEITSLDWLGEGERAPEGSRSSDG